MKYPINDQSLPNCFSEGRDKLVRGGVFINREKLYDWTRHGFLSIKALAKTHVCLHGHR